LFACLAALQGGQAGEAPVSVGSGCGVLRSPTRRSRLSGPWGICRPGPQRRRAIQPCPKPKKVGTAAVSRAWKLDDRAAPYTVPMKAVPQQCGALGRVRPAPRFVRDAHGPSSPLVPVRALPTPGPAVQPLRPWSALLQLGVLASGA